jgi:Arc/MetJ-type ribon-helix-helix transcriptional regulator
VTIHLPEDLERSLWAEVNSGHFASLDDAMAEAVRLLLRERRQPEVSAAAPTIQPDLGSIGAMRDDAELLDRAVEYAMKVREERPWRPSPHPS